MRFQGIYLPVYIMIVLIVPTFNTLSICIFRLCLFILFATINLIFCV